MRWIRFGFLWKEEFYTGIPIFFSIYQKNFNDAAVRLHPDVYPVNQKKRLFSECDATVDSRLNNCNWCQNQLFWGCCVTLSTLQILPL